MTATDALANLDSAQAAFDKTASASGLIAVQQPWSPQLVQYLSLSVLGFTCIALLIAAVLLWRSNAPAQQVLKAIGVLVILGLSGLLLVVGFSNEQLTPIVGLFGAIAGYLLGKDSKSDGGQ